MTNNKLNPPSVSLLEKEWEIAYLKYSLNEVVYTYFFPIVNQINIETIENLKKFGDSYFEKWYGSNGEVWESRYSIEEFKQDFKKHLSSFHNGDCVGQTQTCMRCHAEELFGIESSITWDNKHEGSALYYQHLKENENDNKNC